MKLIFFLIILLCTSCKIFQNEKSIQKEKEKILDEVKNLGANEFDLNKNAKDFIDNFKEKKPSDKDKESNSDVQYSTDCVNWKKEKDFDSKDHMSLFSKSENTITFANSEARTLLSNNLFIKVLDDSIIGFFLNSPFYREIKPELIRRDIQGILQAMMFISVEQSESHWHSSIRKNRASIHAFIKKNVDSEILKKVSGVYCDFLIGCKVLFINPRSTSLLSEHPDIIREMTRLGYFDSSDLKRIEKSCEPSGFMYFFDEFIKEIKFFENKCGRKIDFPAKTKEEVISYCKTINMQIIPMIRSYKK